MTELSVNSVWVKIAAQETGWLTPDHELVNLKREAERLITPGGNDEYLSLCNYSLQNLTSFVNTYCQGILRIRLSIRIIFAFEPE
ncbi:MAG: hypothetical protein F6J87_14355 [Spirulina sp. SIO3F2]|nr:hypothetical protein [Spirulina sp. SIO3F2]